MVFEKIRVILGREAQQLRPFGDSGKFCELFENKKKVGCPCGLKNAIAKGACPNTQAKTPSPAEY